VTFDFHHTYCLFGTPDGLVWGELLEEDAQTVTVRFVDDGPLVTLGKNLIVNRFTPRPSNEIVAETENDQGTQTIKTATLQSAPLPWWRN